MIKKILPLILAALLLLAGYVGISFPKERLCRELRLRGIADYNSRDLKPYRGTIDGCVSYTGDQHWDPKDLWAYQVAGGKSEPGAEGEIIAVTKDLRYCFVMSRVDGILNDIRDESAYIHDGEYTSAEARAELERYLREETDIDPGEYNILVEARWIDGADNYVVFLDEKDATGGDSHAYEFYLSKDLGRIVRIEYREEPEEQAEYLDDISLTGNAPAGVRKIYTQEEVKGFLLDWLSRGPLPQAEEDNIRAEELDENWKRLISGEQLMIYRFRVPREDGSTWRFLVTPDLSHNSWILMTQTEKRCLKPYYVLLKDRT